VPLLGLGAAVVLLVAGLVSRRWIAVAGVIAAAGVLSGVAAAGRMELTLTADVPEGPVVLRARVLDDQRHNDRAVMTVVPVEVLEPRQMAWSGPALAVALPARELPPVGSLITVAGLLRSAPGTVRGDPVAGRLTDAEVTEVVRARFPVLRTGNAVRNRVRSVLGTTPEEALLAGFLIGDTSGVPERDLDALRRSGLTHFVAVSGSNVALFLAGVWVLSAPLAPGIRSRAVIGLLSLAVFVVATRWEPSVLRAATMVAILLITAAFGLPIRPWIALGSAVVVLLLVSGQLAADVGFQLSVVATGGVLVGVRWATGRQPGSMWPRWVWQALGAAIGAQIVVAPILLMHFGSIPLVSPLANLIAGPVVAVTTAVAALAVMVGWSGLVSLAGFGAGFVLVVARLAAEWPQLGWVGAAGVAALVGMALRRSLRPLATAVAVGVIALPVVGWHGPPTAPTMTVLDVGQGDATLIEDPSGATALVDGGRDPFVLAQALRSRSIRRIDLLVVTHGDMDHVGGLVAIADRVAIGRLWYPDQPDLGEELGGLVDELRRIGVVVEAPPVGARFDMGAVTLEVLGPGRRYQKQNDGSVVLWVDAGVTALLAGDIEAVAQRDLPDLRPDVLLVPHHGAATTDLAWLERTVGAVAVVSVGDNTYGHPTPEVMAVLSDVEVHVTSKAGDVRIPLG